MRKTLSAGILGLVLISGAQAFGQAPASTTTPPPAASGATSTANHAQALYYFTLGHMQELQFEEQYEATGKVDLSSDAIDSYKKALALEPNSPAIMERLAEVEAASQRIRDAVIQAQEVLKIDPDNLDAHRLLARIYVRTLGDITDANAQASQVQKATSEWQAILKIAPDDPEAGLWLSRLYRAQNRPDDAEKVLRNVLQKSPDDGDALEQLSQLLIDEGRSQEAIALLAQVADQFSSPAVYDLLGDAYSQAKQYPKAEDAYKKAVDMDPEDPGHRHGLADTLLTENKYSDALEQYKKLAQLEPGTSENYLRMSQLYRQLGKFSDAESSLMRAKQLAPGNLEILDNEALLYEDQGRYDDAVRVLNDAITGMKDSANGTPSPGALAILYEQLGDAYRHAKNYPAALQAYADLAKQSDAAQKRAELLTIDTYRDSRDIDRAIAEAKKALVDSPNDPSLTGSLATLYGDKGDASTATKILQGLLKGTDSDQQVYLDIAEVQEHGKKYSDAELSAQKAEQMARQAEDKQSAWYMLGAIYEREKKYDQAAEEFQKVLDADPNNAPTLNYYGYMLADRGVRLDDASAMIQKAVSQDPNNGAYLDSLGWVYYKQNKFTDAESYLRKAIALDGDDPTILSHLGNVYLKLGQDEKAAETLEKSAAEWQKVLPADYEADKANEVDSQVKALKKHMAQKSSVDSNKPQ
ncbi:MAG TPA: tetratricopeptide repeat protein [Candidatus Acidoferrum sp.]|jgi:tetratricopeptide (TPR) repeat protein|nr:tetratricopeptide repeat protein [Candidatus Acidoferrum sp.]